MKIVWSIVKFVVALYALVLYQIIEWIISGLDAMRRGASNMIHSIRRSFVKH